MPETLSLEQSLERRLANVKKKDAEYSLTPNIFKLDNTACIVQGVLKIKASAFVAHAQVDIPLKAVKETVKGEVVETLVPDNSKDYLQKCEDEAVSRALFNAGY